MKQERERGVCVSVCLCLCWYVCVLVVLRVRVSTRVRVSVCLCVSVCECVQSKFSLRVQHSVCVREKERQGDSVYVDQCVWGRGEGGDERWRGGGGGTATFGPRKMKSWK